ncbi:MAG TPA: hypothetical protein VKU41_29190 [Polyangiaceae bacterium]|nr:hypothetical protein [Polyangiaceae bacterium]
MEHRLPTLLRIASLALIGAGPCACYDFTPITISASPPPAAEGGVSDAATDSDAGPASPMNRCLACASGTADGGGCPSEYSACQAFDACRSAVDCITNQCLASVATAPQCLMQCEDDAGVSSMTSPANGPFSSLFQCMASHCESACLP